MNNLFDQERLKSLLQKSSEEREWAAKEFDAAQKQVLVERSAFFDKLALFHAGTIAATITFSGILHQAPGAAIHWKSMLFASWITLFIAMAFALIRNWQAQNAWFHTTASTLQEYEGKFIDAYGKATTSGGPIIDRETGNQMNPSQVKQGAAEVKQLREAWHKEHKESADKCNRRRVVMERLTFAATATGIGLALGFAMRNF